MKMAAAHVPDEIIKALDDIAERRGVERTKVIRWALVDYIERESLRPLHLPSDQLEVQEEAA